ncbi:MAG TPA: sensor domain-containing diguanylate cyclase, partial [Erythrobacter sp.]|nr:sensor domain-containing diguanylate cyclase [Erythrobacter sp.]
FFSEFDRKKVDRALDKASRHPGRTEILERSVGRGGKTRWLEAKLRAVETSGRKVCGFVVTIRDITARKLEELEMTREARTDTLTGLPNRRA